MQLKSERRYQLLAGGLALLSGTVLGLLVVLLLRPSLVESAVRTRTRFVRSLARVVDPGSIGALADGVHVRSAELRPPGDPFLERGESLVVGEPLPDGRLLVVTFGMEEVKACLRRAYLLLLSLVGAFTILGCLTAGWLVRRWIRPIRELAARMDEVQAGDLTVEFATDRRDEIGELGRHFNAMVSAVRGGQQRSIDTAQRQANIEKFAALGRLSAGVAHEINNPVGGLLAALDVLRDLEPGSRRYRDYLDLMKSGLERIGDIVSQLLRFARRPAGTRAALDLNAMLKEVAHLARLQYRSSRMHIVTRFGALPAVVGEADLLSQLFLNLAMNAYQAMVDGGILTISTAVEDSEVIVTMEDTGPGIPEEHLDRLFEPFFTTKEVGEGTGLGLSVALGIAEAHGGRIEVANRAEGGARFTVRLPIVEERP